MREGSNLLERRLASILSADVVDYSRLMDENEQSAIAVIRELKDIYLEPNALAHGGEILKRMGDGWIIAFPSVTGTVQSATEVQTKLVGHPLIKLRIGAHIGEIVEDETDFYGAGVNLAQRLQTEAPPGGLMVSEDLYRQLSGELADSFRDAGSFKLKNIALPVNGYQWRPQRNDKNRTSDVPTIAVEPFEYAPDDMDTRAAAADLHDQLVLRLSRRTGIRVLDEGTGQLTESVYLLRGRLRISSGRGRLNITLLLRELAQTVLSQTYEGETSDIFAFCDKLIDQADVDLRLQINAFDGDRIANLPDEQLSVSELRSRAASQFYLATIDAWEKFVELMERALRLSPSDPMANAMRAEGIVTLSAAQYKDISQEQQKSLEEGFNRAVEQAPRSDYIFWARGVFGVHVLRDREVARRDIERALSLNPAYPPAYEYLGLIDLLAERYSEAANNLERAVQMSESDPLLPTRLYFLAVSLVCDDWPAEARAAIERAIQLSPSPRSFHLSRAYCCRAQGDEIAAEEADDVATDLPKQASALAPRPPLLRCEGPVCCA